MTRRHLVLVGLVVALGGPLGLVAQKEWTLRHGEQVFLALAPADPRSLIEGDYMRLAYAVNNAVRDERESLPVDGFVVVTVDAERRGTFARIDDGNGLAANELRLRYRSRHDLVRVGTDAFYFQEGDAELYVPAKYGELRVTGSGDAVLVGLRDEALRPLGRAR
jgi:uncharacterized membrane-anchored protein